MNDQHAETGHADTARADTVRADVFREAGKTFDWRPIASPDILLEPVADDARPEMQQVAHYAMLCVAMRATLDETGDIIQALQYCERTHGLPRIAGAFALAAASVENAVELIPSTITQLGVQRQLASPGLFVGALVEQLARIPGDTRKFPLSQYRERMHSPHVEFEDCLIGASIARRLGLLDEMRPSASRPHSRLVTEFRKKRAQEGVLLLDAAARAARGEADANAAGASATDAAQRFIAEVARLSRRLSIPLPAHWRAYIRDHHRGAENTE